MVGSGAITTPTPAAARPNPFQLSGPGYGSNKLIAEPKYDHARGMERISDNNSNIHTGNEFFFLFSYHKRVTFVFFLLFSKQM